MVVGSVAHLTLVIASALRIVHGAIHGAEGIFPSVLKFDDVVTDVLTLMASTCVMPSLSSIHAKNSLSVCS